MSEEKSQNEQLMNAGEIKLTWYHNVLLGMRVYFKVIPLRYQATSLIVGVGMNFMGTWTDHGKPMPLVFQIFLTIAGIMAANLLLWGLGPLFIQLIEDDFIPHLQLHIDNEKEKLQKASLEKIDDILLKK